MNYPWSGRLGRIATKCIYCGESGMSFGLSSAGNRCCRCNSSMTPIPELRDAFLVRVELLAREWCRKNGFDYDEEMKKGPTR